MDLVIIGNGFDLAHDMPTTYADFCIFLKSFDLETYDYLINLFPKAGPNGILLWSDFEESLIYPDRNEIEEWQLYMNGCDSEKPYLNWLFDMIEERFYKWVEDFCFIGTSILPTCHPYYMYLKRDNRFLSFNYTETLEHFYGIYDVLHIHGRPVQNGIVTGDTIYFGHRKIKDSDIYISQTEKPVSHLIRKNSRWFSELPDLIDGSVVVMGFSCSEVDMPYLEHIHSLLPNIPWVFFYYSNEDYRRIKKCVEELKLKSNQYSILKA